MFDKIIKKIQLQPLQCENLYLKVLLAHIRVDEIFTQINHFKELKGYNRAKENVSRAYVKYSFMEIQIVRKHIYKHEKFIKLKLVIYEIIYTTF